MCRAGRRGSLLGCPVHPQGRGAWRWAWPSLILRTPRRGESLGRVAPRHAGGGEARHLEGGTPARGQGRRARSREKAGGLAAGAPRRPRRALRARGGWQADCRNRACRAAAVSAARGDLVPPKPSAAPSKLLRRFPLLALSVFNQQMSCFIFVWWLCSPFSVPPPTSWSSNLGPAGLPGFLGEGPALRPQQPGRRVRSRGHCPLPLLRSGPELHPVSPDAPVGHSGQSAEGSASAD